MFPSQRIDQQKSEPFNSFHLSFCALLSRGLFAAPPLPSPRFSSSPKDDHAKGEAFQPSSMKFQLENPLTDFHSDNVSFLFITESDHMLSEKYTAHLKFGDFDVSKRREVVSLISQICSKFNNLVPYLAVNYMDRFLSTQKLKQTKPWVLRIIAVSCVSLAAKMQEMSFSVFDLQGNTNGGFIFDQETIQRMEVVILGALKWRMRSITPLSFIPFFISLFQLKDPPLRQALKIRAMEIIFSAQNDINLLGFKPSIVAASALASASHQLFPLQTSIFKNAISNCSSVIKENLIHCCETMQEQIEAATMEGNEDTTDTPINVLDQRFSSATSDSETTEERGAKRRRNF